MLANGFAPSACAQTQQSIFVALSGAAAPGRNQLVKRDQTLFWVGDPVDGYYRVISGAVRLCKMMPDGRRQISDFFGPGDLILIELSAEHAFTAEAVTDSVICHYPRPTIDALLADPKFSRQLLTIACDRLVSAHHRMAVLGRKTAEERLATFLVTSAKRLPASRQVMSLPMSRADIADYLGLTVETVSRVLSKFRRDGLIDLPDSHSVRIMDRDQLERLSDGDA
ncbi:hypothetical protein GCM10011611_57530 [Aliidongia dinghuensis]|uniref:Crp/Fnr family transcriptional regulator n=1 Tax=Aliidongia dinghuensis TaxID=1867774 RepID=A0A8J2YZ29_9PROT|nr:helix-turn-helix domain-containing protein [Aliidongia dinghuensis]GGF43596.1 hypothetical protein GCM10011611_57530 [Aliidongia dinghuensis]